MKHLLWGLLLLATQVFGASIPAAITGDYSGFKFSCRFEAGIHYLHPDHRALTLRCTLPNNQQTGALALVYGCPNEWTMLPLNEWGGDGVKSSSIISYINPIGEKVDVIADIGSSLKTTTPWVRIVSYRLGDYVDVLVGPYSELVVGGGTPYRFNMHQVTDLIPPLSYYPECYFPPPVVIPPPPPFDPTECNGWGCN